MTTTKEKIFGIGCKLIAFYISSSVEEERRKKAKFEIYGLLEDIKRAPDKNRIRSYSISKFKVSPLEPETDKFLEKIGYTLKWNREDDDGDWFFELIKA